MPNKWFFVSIVFFVIGRRPRGRFPIAVII